MTLPNRTQKANSSTQRHVSKKQSSLSTKKMMDLLNNLSHEKNQVRLKSTLLRLGPSNNDNRKHLVAHLNEKSKNCSPFKQRFERRKNLSKDARNIFHSWLKEHTTHPYPSDVEKKDLAQRAETSVEQVGTWFVNARVRTLPKLLGTHKKKKQKLKR